MFGGALEVWGADSLSPWVSKLAVMDFFNPAVMMLYAVVTVSFTY